MANLRYNPSLLVVRFLSAALFTVSALTLLSGCALFGPYPTHVDAIIEAGADINPNADGKPAPLVLRIYELSSIDTFQNSDFFALYDDEAATIGKDILEKYEVEVRPNEKYTYNRSLNLGTRYIGVIAAYRSLDHSQWRASFEIPQNQTTELLIQARRLAVSINKKK